MSLRRVPLAGRADVRGRGRQIGGDGRIMQSAAGLTFRAMESDPISVRITYDD